MFFVLKTDNIFRQSYFELLKYQLTRGSLQLENISAEALNIQQSMSIFSQYSAINYIFQNGLDYSHIGFTNGLCELVRLVSNQEINGFRKTKAEVNGSKVERSKPSMIRNDLWYLVDDYNYMISQAKNTQELFQIEAIFHIRFLHIHPFEDANGRTARIILAYNLASHNLAPSVITPDKKRVYCDYIENGDYKGLANMFEKLSNKELKIMTSIYTNLDEKGLINSNKLTEEQLNELRKLGM